MIAGLIPEPAVIKVNVHLLRCDLTEKTLHALVELCPQRSFGVRAEYQLEHSTVFVYIVHQHRKNPVGRLFSELKYEHSYLNEYVLLGPVIKVIYIEIMLVERSSVDICLISYLLDSDLGQFFLCQQLRKSIADSFSCLKCSSVSFLFTLVPPVAFSNSRARPASVVRTPDVSAFSAC